MNLISLGPVFIAFIITIYDFLKFRYRNVLIMMLAWGFALNFDIFLILSILFLSKGYFFISIYSVIPIGFLVILFFDSITRRSVDPIKIMIMTAVAVLTILTSLDPSSVILITHKTGGLSLVFTGNFAIAVGLYFALLGIFWVYLMLKIYLKAPTDLRFYSGINLIGATLVGIIAPSLALSGVTTIFPGITLLVFSIGALFCAIAFLKEPRLSYILPFQVYDLLVIETEGGVPIFTYKFREIIDDKMDSMLFSGMMHALNKFTEGSMQKKIREIHLDEAILIMNRSSELPLVCVLIASRSSQLLRDALSSFANKFYKNYSSLISKKVKHEIFEDASKLVEEFFPFIPLFKK
ncbi:MAG: hypothetical protein ACTSR3_16530 [Candidatus Helarchaeota archaeon]